jgi:signal transduction histidine kinase
MTRLRSSAAYRIAFANFIVFAAGLAFLGVIVFAAMHAAFSRQLDATITDEAQSLIDEYHSGGMQELGDEIVTRERSRSPTRMLYAVFGPNGVRIAGHLQTQRPRLGLHDIQFIDGSEGPDAGRAKVIDLSPNERLVVATDREWIERIDTTVIAVFAAAFAAASLLGLAGAAIFGGYLRRRLRLISQTAEAIIGGDRQRRMPVSKRRDEFDELAQTLNRMLDRIERLVENLRQVSSDIAHDLRTPLARLRTRLEQGINRDDGCDPTGVLEDAIHRVDGVLALFAAILRIAEVESGQTRRFFGPVDLSVLADELAESYAPAIQDGGRTLLWSLEDSVKVHGDRELISQAIINLIENAQRHTPQGTVIRLVLVTAGAWACVGVSDNGPGVPKGDLDRVTHRFIRLDESRNTAGFGLGLSLVRAVADLHGGQLKLKRTEPGLSAIIELPRERIGDDAVECDDQPGMDA